MNPSAQRYQDAASFRQALESRLNSISKAQETDLERLRKQVAFDRFLARVFLGAQKPRWFLKGGYAMELRFLRLARATKDVDLSVPAIQRDQKDSDEPLSPIREELQDLAERDLGDWFVYLLRAPVMELDAAPYGGARFPVEVRLAGRKFTNFNLDVGVGDAVLFEPEWRRDHDLLKFAGVPSAKIPLLPREQQFAEKIHAYSLPREGNPNSRTRDLVDLVLLIENGLSDTVKMRKALQATFKRRETHEIPAQLTSPPATWSRPYRVLAEECGTRRKTLEEAFQLLREFWDTLS